MTEDEFYLKVQENFLQYLDKSLYTEDTEVVLDDTVRNHIVLKGLSCKDAKSNCSPHIYLNHAWYGFSEKGAM